MTDKDRIEELALKLLAAEGQASDNLERAEAMRKENERLKEAIEAFWACPSEDNMDLMICAAREGEPSSAALQGETD